MKIYDLALICIWGKKRIPAYKKFSSIFIFVTFIVLLLQRSEFNIDCPIWCWYGKRLEYNSEWDVYHLDYMVPVL